jgi:hypothetical protein
MLMTLAASRNMEASVRHKVTRMMIEGFNGSPTRPTLAALPAPQWECAIYLYTRRILISQAIIISSVLPRNHPHCAHYASLHSDKSRTVHSVHLPFFSPLF